MDVVDASGSASSATRSETNNSAITDAVSIANLRDWRGPNDPSFPAENFGVRWQPYEQFFLEKGYQLFKTIGGSFLYMGVNGEDSIRPADQYHCVSEAPEPNGFAANSRKHMPALRLSDGIWVLIQIICVGNDGKNELEVLHYLQEHADPANPALPILDELFVNEKVFMVFPMVSVGAFYTLFFDTIGEVIDGIEQIFRGMEFLHRHKIAHRDFGNGDILDDHVHPCTPGLRSLHPTKWYIVDYQYSTLFSATTPKEQTLVRGFPFSRYDYKPEDYGKVTPPEFHTGEPFDPFLADIYQLGMTMIETFEYCPRFAASLPTLQTLLQKMTADNPLHRPSMVEVCRQYEVISADVEDRIRHMSLRD